MQYKPELRLRIEIPLAKRKRSLTLQRLQMRPRRIDEPDICGLKVVDLAQLANRGLLRNLGRS